MQRLSSAALLALGLVLTAACAGKKDAASASAARSAVTAPSAADAARRAHLVEIFVFKYPGMAEVNPEINELRASEYQGLDSGMLEVGRPPARQKLPFFVSHDDKKLYLLNGEPLDASRSLADLKAEKRAALEKLVAGKPMRGNPNGKVIVVEYSDFQCPYCRQAFLNVQEMLRRSPDARFYYQNFPLSSIHPWATAAAQHGTCAARQSGEAFWKLHDGYFNHQGELTAGNLHQKSLEFTAGVPKFDAAAFSACATDPNSRDYQAAAAEVKASAVAAQQFGMNGTPGFLINGTVFPGLLSADDLSSQVAQALKP